MHSLRSRVIVGGMRFLRIFRRVVLRAWSGSVDLAQAIIFIVAIAIGALTMFPSLSEIVSGEEIRAFVISWQFAAIVLGSIIIARFIAAIFYVLFEKNGGLLFYLKEKLGAQMGPVITMLAGLMVFFVLFLIGIFWFASTAEKNTNKILSDEKTLSEKFSILDANLNSIMSKLQILDENKNEIIGKITDMNKALGKIDEKQVLLNKLEKVYAIDADLPKIQSLASELIQSMYSYASNMGSTSISYLPQRAEANIVMKQREIVILMRPYVNAEINFLDIAPFEINKPVQGEEKYQNSQTAFDFRKAFYQAQSAERKLNVMLSEIKSDRDKLNNEVIASGRKK